MQQACQDLVVGKPALLAVDDEENGVGLLDRHPGLGLDGAAEALLGVRIEPRRVDQQQPPVAYLDLLRDPVAGDPRLALDEHAPPPRVAVEERRLADIGSADNRDDRKLCAGRHGGPGRREEPPRAGYRGCQRRPVGLGEGFA